MVKVRAELVRDASGTIDINHWVQELVAKHGALDIGQVLSACHWLKSVDGADAALLESGIELAELAAAMELDTESVLAALSYRVVRSGTATPAEIGARFGEVVVSLVEAVERMGAASVLEMSNARLQTSERRDQVENVRHMLVAMLDDARVAVLKLAERIVALRAAKLAPEARRQRIAREAHLVFAPLANRLGIWRLKWELEDLALRYLAPDIYISIARQLSGRREERERQVAGIALEVEARLRERGLSAAVTGRAKHFYSIWRKMQAKHVGIDQVHDVRAVRVLVEDIAACYAALGIIHTAWRHIPSEFDDYIAAPKENGYRSIHTAVVGPDGRTLEVQIRTHEMHREAELGVCAHWAYKERDDGNPSYALKMNWLRQVVDQRHGQVPVSPLAASVEFGEELQQLFQEERIFVYTPKGHVVDLPAQATALDFAYRVHTEIGHRCVGALVDGVAVPLDAALRSGQRVEILTQKEAQPERVWLDLHLGFTRTARARQKVREWFRGLATEQNETAGRKRLDTLLAQLCLHVPEPAALRAVAAAAGFDSAQALHVALGAGDCQLLDVIDLIERQGGSAAHGATDHKSLEVQLEAPDRDGLLHDVVGALRALDIPLIANSGRVDPVRQLVVMRLEVPAQSLRQSARLIERLSRIEGVLDVRVLDN
jgi:GTP pyrophosphokinase